MLFNKFCFVGVLLSSIALRNCFSFTLLQYSGTSKTDSQNARCRAALVMHLQCTHLKVKRLPCHTANVQFFQTHCRADHLFRSATSQTERKRIMNMILTYRAMLVTNLREDERNSPSNWLPTVKHWLLTDKELFLKLKSWFRISWRRWIKGPPIIWSEPWNFVCKTSGAIFAGWVAGPDSLASQGAKIACGKPTILLLHRQLRQFYEAFMPILTTGLPPLCTASCRHAGLSERGGDVPGCWPSRRRWWRRASWSCRWCCCPGPWAPPVPRLPSL